MAHVTVRTDNDQAGGFAVYTVRVPNESEEGSTVRVEVQIPEGLEASRYEPKPGWTMALADGVLTIDGGSLAPGEFAEFRFQARNPETPGTLSFAAIQTYDDGEVVNWTGAPDTDTPASVVEIVAGEANGEETGSGSEEGDDTDLMPLLGVILGGIGTLLGGAALLMMARKT
jgi:uncharacterized protein YcnI